MKYVLLFLLAGPGIAQGSNLVDDSQACDSLMIIKGVQKTSPTYQADLATCQTAREECVRIRKNLTNACSDANPQSSEVNNENWWASNMATASALSINEMNKHMANFCEGYMADKMAQDRTCSKADSDCQKRKWALTNGSEIICQNFSVESQKHVKGSPRVLASLCNMAHDLAVKVNNETINRQQACQKYGFIAGQTTGNPGQEAESMGLDSAEPMESAPAAVQQEGIPKDGISPENPSVKFENGVAVPSGDNNGDGVIDDMDFEMVPSPNQNSAFEQMPEKGLVDQFFDLFR